ncbi:MAG TPA: hypothetical protein VLF18_20555 [Tahibacter sp.]|uniref:hypothetical protein n=1 Tax=Tahibacter sp. TaxID=2056211 RepID=UPI002C2462F7|nr:hypothetical protein [Tahibacter sp.]HSX62581.1 hypothetical protein [Tahibacter sp.]
MSNHLHIVVQMSPSAASTWSDEDVADRWIRLFPRMKEDVALRRQQLLADTARLNTIRARLGNLSWLMRCLAEPIARRANQEDGCKGRFWEGRFKCQLLCDERAVLAAMTYVDLNPIRAGLAERLDASAHTGACERIAISRASPENLRAPLRPLIGPSLSTLPLCVADYLQILDWTGRVLAPGKPGRIADDAPAILATIDASQARWTMRVRGYGSGWARAAGSALDLTALAERLGQRWLKGIGLALQLG